MSHAFHSSFLTPSQFCSFGVTLISSIRRFPQNKPTQILNLSSSFECEIEHKSNSLPSSRLSTLMSSPTVPSPSYASPVLILSPSPVILLVSEAGLDPDMDPSGAGGTSELLLLRPFLALTGGAPSVISILGDKPSLNW